MSFLHLIGSAFIALAVSFGWTNTNLGTIYTTNSSDTLNTFRTNVNQSLANLQNSALATSTSETSGQLPYFTSTSGTPPVVGAVSTTSVTGASGVSITAGAGALVGGSNATISLSTIAANSVLANNTGGTAAPSVAVSTTTLFGTLGTAGQVLTSSNGKVVWAATSTISQPPTVTSYFSRPAWMATTTTTNNNSSITTSSVYQFSLPTDIAFTKFTVYVLNANGTGDHYFGIYSEDGQTQKWTGTISIPQNPNRLMSVTTAQAYLTAGNYYLAHVPADGSKNAVITAWAGPYGADAGVGLLSNSAGKDLSGTLTVSAGTLPSTFDPSALATTTPSKEGIIFRLD